MMIADPISIKQVPDIFSESIELDRAQPPRVDRPFGTLKCSSLQLEMIDSCQL